MIEPLELAPDLVSRFSSIEADEARDLFARLQQAAPDEDAQLVSNRFAAIADPLNGQLIRSADPLRSLRNFVRIMESADPNRGRFYERLGDEPGHLRALGYLAGWSDFLAHLISSEPGLVGILFDLFDGPLRIRPST